MHNLDEIIAIREFCASCTIPVIAELDNRVGTEGTGSIFVVDGRTFFITASHVAKLILENPNDIGIPTGKNKSEILTFKDCNVVKPENYGDQKKI